MTGPVALVTGASRGIGRGLAAFFIARGYTVVGCSRTESASIGAGYTHRTVDVTDDHSVRELIGWIGTAFGRLDVVINNAGVGMAALEVGANASDVERVIRTNLLGAMSVCRESARLMTRLGAGGRIVNLASVAVPLQMQGSAAYSASKAGLIQYTKVLARELATFNVTCNVVAPSLIDTEMMGSLKPKIVDRYLAALTIKRPAKLDDVTNAIWFFASPESSYITGQVLYLGLAA